MGNEQNIILREEDIPSNLKCDCWEWRICPICGRRFFARKKYSKITCSEDCYKEYVLEHKKEINKKRSESLKATNKLKAPEEKQQELAKARKTCLERYGVEMYQKTDEYRAKMSKIFSNKDWSERSNKIKEELQEKYAEICNHDNLELLEFNNRFDCLVRCKECNNTFGTHVLGYLTYNTTHNLCRECHPAGNLIHDTQPAQFVKAILDEYNIEYKESNRSIISPYEIDIFIPSLNLGFEINGNYWHSEIGGNKDKNYHINKTVMAYDKGIKLIQIFEDEIVKKPEIVRSRIINLLGKTENKIFARKCSIKEVSYHDKRDFFEENHIDGDSVSKYNIGLYYQNELVCLGSFGSRKISGKENHELIRFATKINTNVIGGFSKILSYYKKKYEPKTLITYADIRWSGINHDDNVYIKNGFKFEKNTSPNYFYEDKHDYLKRLNRMNFSKSKLIKMGYDKNLTESQIMFNENYDRIWDCGSMKFIMN